MNKIVPLSGYSVTEEIFTDSQTSIYRGSRNSDGYPVTIEILRDRSRCFNRSLQFQNQYTIGKLFDSPNIVKTLALEADSNDYALILEDFGGISLADRLCQLGTFGNNSQTLTAFLHIAVQIADALDELYCRRVIHKDLKPANILINPETQQIKLTNFRIASLLPREIQEIQGGDIIEGTLGYISPEQTGRMNRGIDYRTDFYALGVTFYELLTGQLPFIAQDPMDSIHSHLARSPVPSHQLKPEIPLAISQIVSKLMSKNPPDRYQSALGLKYDFNICLDQLEQTGKIELFTLGARDLSDRFLISEQFYGRELEIATVLDAFERVSNGKAEILLVAGSSGIGKSAIVQEIHKPIVSKRGYFIKGKYDQLQRNIPFSAVVEAFRDLIRQLFCQSDAQKKIWKDSLLTAVGENGQILIDLIPELEIIIGKQLPAPALSSSAAEQRFNLLIQKFVRVFATAAHPLVLFLDDLQWADLASLNLLQLLMQDLQHLLLIGAYRDNEVSSVHPSILTLDEIQKNGTIVNTITLKPLSRENLNQLIADTLNCGLCLAEPLTELVDLKTKGNPFFTNQFLKALHEDGLISFEPLGENGAMGGWRCDLTGIRAFAISDDVVEFMALQLQKLPAETQAAIALAAAIGTQFDLNTLAIVLERSPQDTAMILWTALQQNLLLPTTEIYKFFTRFSTAEDIPSESSVAFNPVYRFVHDRIQQAAYSLIPDRHKKATHLKIGQLLQKNLADMSKSAKIFDIIGHLNLAKELITNPIDRVSLAQFNLTAGKKARDATAYAAANSYLQMGIELLPSHCWETEYQLTLDLHIVAAEAAYLSGDLDGMEQISAIVLQSARTILDKVEVYRIQIAAMTANGKMLEAIAIGEEALAQLGIELPLAPDEAITKKTLQSLEIQLEGRKIEDLLNLPMMSDFHAQAKMKLLADLGAPVFVAMPELYPILSLTMVRLSIQFGNTPTSACGYINYGLVLIVFLGNVKSGYCFGELGLELINHLCQIELKGRILFLFTTWMHHRCELVKSIALNWKNAYAYCIEIGDFLNAGYSISCYFDANIISGMELSNWESEIFIYTQNLENIKQYSTRNYLNIKHQFAQNLIERESQVDYLIGNIYNEPVMIPKHLQGGDLTALAYVYIYKLMLAYLFNKYTAALENISHADQYLLAVSGMILIPVFHFYAALTHLVLTREQSAEEQIKTLTQVEIHQGTIDLWAQDAPMNYLHKSHLIEAEKQRILGNKVGAIEHYDLAIAGAKEHQFTHEEALANELAMKFYLDWGKEHIAQIYAIEAYQCYDRWGANAKLEQLINLYPQFFTQELIDPSKSEIDDSPLNSAALDLNTLIQASYSISQDEEIDRSISKLLDLVLVTSGADKCVLILKEDETLKVVAKLEEGKKVEFITPTPFEFTLDIPNSVVNYVRNNLALVLSKAEKQDSQFAKDTYLLEHQPKSFLCIPILNQSDSIGILYLENKQTKDVFTPQRLDILQIIISQAAISLENARLYRELKASLTNLEKKVEERTIELQVAKEAAEFANKNRTIFFNNMSHELRSPINTILSISERFKSAQDTNLNLVQLDYLQTIDSSSIHLRAMIDDILDLAKIEAGKLELNCSTINIKHLCDSSLIFFKELTLQKQIRLELDISPNLPELSVDERRMRQVLINLLSNAVKFTPEKGCITLEVRHIIANDLPGKNSDSIQFVVIDTGVGITPENLDLLFQPFSQIDSTMSRQSQGTGLGLNLVKEIVELHGGRVSISSKIEVGSRFIVDLPIVDLPFVFPLTKDSISATSTQLPTHDPNGKANRQILILDENMIDADSISDYLESKEYTTILAANGREAIDLANLHHPAAILINMPVLDDVFTIEQLRNNPQFAKLPILILTSPDITNLEAFLEAGASHHLIKPITLQFLAATIQDLVAMISKVV